MRKAEKVWLIAAAALVDIEGYVAAHPGMAPEELAQQYAAETGLPHPPAKSMYA